MRPPHRSAAVAPRPRPVTRTSPTARGRAARRRRTDSNKASRSRARQPRARRSAGRPPGYGSYAMIPVEGAPPRCRCGARFRNILRRRLVHRAALTVTWVTQGGSRTAGREGLLIQAKFQRRWNRVTGATGRSARSALLVLGVALYAGSAAAAGDGVAPLLDGMGTDHGPVASRVPAAQRYFHQGMTLTWGFNPAEAARSFEAAIRADPRCALCRWGLAWALGPNINSDMDAGAAERVRAALAGRGRWRRTPRRATGRSSTRCPRAIRPRIRRGPRRGCLRRTHARAGPGLSAGCRPRDACRRSAAQSASRTIGGTRMGCRVHGHRKFARNSRARSPSRRTIPAPTTTGFT